MEAPMALSLVKGDCPACGLSALFVAVGGWLTCSNEDCPCPDTMVAFKVRESGLPFRRKGDRLPTGEEFIGYTGDGSPMWKEPVQPARPTVEQLVAAIAEERRCATGTAEHNDARTELYRLAALAGRDAPGGG